jgi:UDP-N-acetylglucosamine--N-acetylmuramyl-(pentapeptide) pyrophosphoryl-undecaprenol N-acetylglucosamine transferase
VKTRRVIISGGGTGGHVYPALAVGGALIKKDPALELVFVGSRREIEKQIMESHGVRFIPLRIEGLRGRGWRSLRGFVLLPAAFLKSLSLLVRIRPSLVIGVGGYSSGPIVLLASGFRIPTLLLEQNVRPGLTNRMLVRRARKAVAAFAATLPALRGKGVWLGNPVREEFERIPRKAETDTMTLLVFGGSQGSNVLNRTVASALPLLRESRGRLAVIHQTGKDDCEWVQKAYRDSGFDPSSVAPYYPEMADCFQKADLIVSRAGATTCAELIAAGKPSLLIPFAGASENHQEWNARELEKAGGAEVILEKDLTPALLAERILFYLGRRGEIQRMAAGLAGLKTEGAAGAIADLCFKLMAGEA